MHYLPTENVYKTRNNWTKSKTIKEMNTTRRPGILGVQSSETIYEWCAALSNTLYMKDSKLCIIIAVLSSILIY